MLDYSVSKAHRVKHARNRVDVVLLCLKGVAFDPVHRLTLLLPRQCCIASPGDVVWCIFDNT